MRSEAGARGSGDGEPTWLTVQNDGSIGGGDGRANAADPANFPVYNQMPEGPIITPNVHPVQPWPIGQVMEDEPPMPMSSVPLQVESETAVPSAAGDV